MAESDILVVDAGTDDCNGQYADREDPWGGFPVWVYEGVVTWYIFKHTNGGIWCIWTALGGPMPAACTYYGDTSADPWDCVWTTGGAGTPPVPTVTEVVGAIEYEEDESLTAVTVLTQHNYITPYQDDIELTAISVLTEDDVLELAEDVELVVVSVLSSDDYVTPYYEDVELVVTTVLTSEDLLELVEDVELVVVAVLSSEDVVLVVYEEDVELVVVSVLTVVEFLELFEDEGLTAVSVLSEDNVMAFTDDEELIAVTVLSEEDILTRDSAQSTSLWDWVRAKLEC